MPLCCQPPPETHGHAPDSEEQKFINDHPELTADECEVFLVLLSCAPDPEPFAKHGINKAQWRVLAEACLDRDKKAAAAANAGPNSDTLVKAAKEAADAYDKALKTYEGSIPVNLAANEAMQTRLTDVFDGM